MDGRLVRRQNKASCWGSVSPAQSTMALMKKTKMKSQNFLAIGVVVLAALFGLQMPIESGTAATAPIVDQAPVEASPPAVCQCNCDCPTADEIREIVRQELSRACVQPQLVEDPPPAPVVSNDCPGGVCPVATPQNTQRTKQTVRRYSTLSSGQRGILGGLFRARTCNGGNCR